MNQHQFVGEHPDHCFLVLQEGTGGHGRPRFAYCGASNEAPCHEPNIAMIAAREVVKLINNVKVETRMADAANTLSCFDVDHLAAFRAVVQALMPVVDFEIGERN